LIDQPDVSRLLAQQPKLPVFAERPRHLRPDRGGGVDDGSCRIGALLDPFQHCSKRLLVGAFEAILGDRILVANKRDQHSVCVAAALSQ